MLIQNSKISLLENVESPSTKSLKVNIILPTSGNEIRIGEKNSTT